MLGWLFAFLTSLSATRHYRGRVQKLISDNFTCCYSETERGNHDFFLSRSHYTDTDSTSRERVWGPCPQPTDQRLHALPTELMCTNAVIKSMKRKYEKSFKYQQNVLTFFFTFSFVCSPYSERTSWP